MSRDAKNKALTAEEPACAVCGVEGGHAPGCWVGNAAPAEAPAEEPTTEAPAEDKDDE
jgi:hypothetical protein